MIFSSAFWSILVVILVLALIFFLRERRNLSQSKSAAAIWQQFVAWLKESWWRLRLRVQAGRLQLPIQLMREKKREKSGERWKPPWRFIRLSGLSPREQIRYFLPLNCASRWGEGCQTRNGRNAA